MSTGIPIGLRNLVYAVLVSDPATGTATYQAPVQIKGAISAKINPNSSVDTLFADDGPYESATTLGKIQLDLNVADLDLDTQAALLGHTVSGGVLMRKAGDIPPWVGIGFKSLKSNGKFRYTWLAKGKFGLPQQDNATQADKLSFQTATVTGSFVKRDCDDEWERHIDEDHINYMPSMGLNWFNSPYGSGKDTVAPTITSIAPANDAITIAVNSSVVWTFSEAIALATATQGNFMLANDATGAAIVGSLSINAARTQVTFTPTANLAAATAYRTIVSADVTDLAGNPLASPSVTKFTTA